MVKCKKCGDLISDEFEICYECKNSTDEEIKQRVNKVTKGKKSGSFWNGILFFIAVYIIIKFITPIIVDYKLEDDFKVNPDSENYEFKLDMDKVAEKAVENYFKENPRVSPFDTLKNKAKNPNDNNKEENKILSSLSKTGQEKVIFKDGRSYEINELISSCDMSFGNQSIGNAIDKKVFCKCFVEKFAKDFTYNELMKLINTDSAKDSRIFFENNENKLSQCIKMSRTSNKPIVDLVLTDNDKNIKELVKFLKPELLSQFSDEERDWIINNVDVDNLVICYAKELEKTNLISKAVNNSLNSSDNEIISNILIRCIEKNIINVV